MTRLARPAVPPWSRFQKTTLYVLYVLLAGALVGCAAGQSSHSTQAGLAAVFNDVRHHPDNRSTAELECTELLKSGKPIPGFAAMLSGLLEVSKADALGAYCAAMVEASIANEMTEADFRRLQLPREVRGTGPFGEMLRKVIIAHERLKSRQAVSSTSARPSVAQG